MRIKVPKYIRHSGGRARVYLNGRYFPLGKYNTPESLAKYAEIVGEFLRTGMIPESLAKSHLTIAELIGEYLDFYRDQCDPTPDSEPVKCKYIFNKWLRNYLRKVAGEFSRENLLLVRDEMIGAGRMRTGINADIKRVLRMFKWAAENKRISEETYKSLAKLKPLRVGAEGVEEPRKRLPVDLDIFRETLKHCEPVFADMARVQFLGACRLEELLCLKRGMFKLEGRFLVCRLTKHKTARLGKRRILMFTRKGRRILKKYLHCHPDAYIFTRGHRLKKQEQQQKTDLLSSSENHQTPMHSKGPMPQTSNKRITRHLYIRHIARACKKAFPQPEGLNGEALAEWKSKHWWTPGRIRHTAATRIAELTNIESAAAVLGHSRVETTQIYAEDTLKRAKEAIEKLG